MKKVFNKTLLKAKGFLRSPNFPALVLAVGFLLIPGVMHAEEDAFATASGIIRRYGNSVKTLMETIAAVICIVGAFNVYFKMQNGDQDVKKTIMLTIGGCIAFIALAQALPAFFSVKFQ